MLNPIPLKARIYIAGHTGLLGSAVYRFLKKKGHTELITRTHGELDLLNEEKTRFFFEETKPEYVFLCAAKVGGIVANQSAQAQFLYENMQIQNHVIHQAHQHGVKKLLFVGSTCIYPKEATNPIKEESLLTGPLEPTNEGYALAKLAGIKLCQFYGEQYGSPFFSAIPCNLYGPHDRYDLQLSHYLPTLLMKIRQCELDKQSTIHLWGTGKPRREYLHSDDCASALYTIMGNYTDPSPINVGAGIDHSIKEIAEMTLRVLNKPFNLSFDLEKPDGTFQKLCDTQKLQHLGWRPQIPLELGIKDVYEQEVCKIIF